MSAALPPLTAGARHNLNGCIAMIILTTVAVFARFASNLELRRSPQGHDWLCLLSVALFIAQSGLIINFIVRYHAFALGPPLDTPAVIELLKVTWISEFLFGGIITSVKLSILWFYYSIFAITQAYRRVIIATAGVCVVWFIVTTFIVIFQCHPVEAFWTKLLFSQYCLDTTKFILGYEMTNLFIDVSILCIPIGIVRRLQLNMFKKIAISGIFLLGALTCVASMVRLTAIWRPPHPELHLDFSTALLFGTLQSGLAIVCACLPTLGPLFRAATKFWTGSVKSLYGTGRSRSTTARDAYEQRNKVSCSSSSNPSHSWRRVEEQHQIEEHNWIRERRGEGDDAIALNPIPSDTSLIDDDEGQRRHD